MILYITPLNVYLPYELSNISLDKDKSPKKQLPPKIEVHRAKYHDSVMLSRTIAVRPPSVENPALVDK